MASPERPVTALPSPAQAHARGPQEGTIRRAKPADHDELARLYQDSRRTHFHWSDPSSFALTDFARDSAGEVIHVACDTTGRITGFCSVWEADAFVHLLFIAPGCEGQGVGRQLLHQLATWLPYPHRLKCVSANDRALAFYRHLGWQETGEGFDGDQLYLEMEKSAV